MKTVLIVYIVFSIFLIGFFTINRYIEDYKINEQARFFLRYDNPEARDWYEKFGEGFESLVIYDSIMRSRDLRKTNKFICENDQGNVGIIILKDVKHPKEGSLRWKNDCIEVYNGNKWVFWEHWK